MKNPSTQVSCVQFSALKQDGIAMYKILDKEISSLQSSPAMTATVYPILLMISFSHMMNDTIQSLIPSIYPLVKKNFHLNFAQIGLITLTFQLAASLLQPLVGLYTDHRPKPFSLVTGMGFTLIGLISL